MTDVELLPLPPLHIAPSVEPVDYPDVAQALMDYARANIDAATAAKDAEIEALRAEVERLRADLMESDEIREKLGHLLTRTAAALKGEPPEGVWHSWHDLPELAERLAEEVREAREFLDKIVNAIGNDQLRRFIEKHGEPVPLTTRLREAEARAERLAEALRRYRNEVPIGHQPHMLAHEVDDLLREQESE